MNKLLSILTVFLYLATYPYAFGGIVLCIGDDGHSEFEFAIGNKCAEIPPIDSHDHTDHQQESSNVNITNDHCGGCEDVQFISEYTVSSSPKLVNTIYSSNVASCEFDLLEHHTQTSHYLIEGRANEQNSYPQILRKIILLI